MKHQTTSATFLGDVRVLVIGVQPIVNTWQLEELWVVYVPDTNPHIGDWF